jgi:hypothetical protein
MRDQFWKFYIRTRFELYYFHEYLNDSYRWSRYIDGFLALASCGSIAAWAAWKAVALLWAAVIAASQVVGALKQYLPYAKRIQALGGLLPRLELLVDSIDHMWFMVDRKEMTDAEINDAIFAFEKECLDLSGKFLAGVYFPYRNDLCRAAQGRADRYFSCFQSLRGWNADMGKKREKPESEKPLAGGSRSFIQVPAMLNDIPAPKEKTADAPPKEGGKQA